MPSLRLKYGSTVYQIATHGLDGCKLATVAVELTALAFLAGEAKAGWSRLHLYALAIELSFKSLALRAGATPQDTRNASHRITKMIALVEAHGASVPEKLKSRLNDDKWFKSMLDSRYPIGNAEVFFHSNYPEMISEILEIKCNSPLGFKGGSALAEIKEMVECLRGSTRGSSLRKFPRF